MKSFLSWKEKQPENALNVPFPMKQIIPAAGNPYERLHLYIRPMHDRITLRSKSCRHKLDKG